MNTYLLRTIMNIKKLYLLACIVFAFAACNKQQNSDLTSTQATEKEKTTFTGKISPPETPASATMRGLIVNPERAIEAVYGIDLNDEFTITLAEVAKLPSDKSTLQSYEAPMDEFGEITIPSSATDFWLVPLDPAQAPMRIAGGTSVKQRCKCPGGGTGCTMTVGDDCNATCNQGTCTSEDDCYLQSDNPPAIAISLGSAIVVPAQAIIFNGVRYQ